MLKKDINSTRNVLMDINKRLEDLDKNSRESQAMSSQAMALINDLKDQSMRNIEMDIEDIEIVENLIEDNIRMSNDQLNASTYHMKTADEEMRVYTCVRKNDKSRCPVTGQTFG